MGKFGFYQVVMIVLFIVSAVTVGAETKSEMTSYNHLFEIRNVAGWTVYVNKQDLTEYTQEMNDALEHLCAQFYQAALKAHPEIPAEIEGGKFDTLHGWLQENIYRHGGKYTTNELVERATGGPLRVGPYLDYLRAKYGRLYQL